MDMHGRPLRQFGWDYSKSGVYFVTFVVAGRRPILRDLTGRLSRAGGEVMAVWERFPTLNPRVVLDEVAVMADHVHAVLFLTNHPIDRATLGSVIRRWKAASTRAIHHELPDFTWQSHFHDWVIRDRSALARFREYVRRNRGGLGGVRDSSRPGPGV